MITDNIQKRPYSSFIKTLSAMELLWSFYIRPFSVTLTLGVASRLLWHACFFITSDPMYNIALYLISHIFSLCGNSPLLHEMGHGCIKQGVLVNSARRWLALVTTKSNLLHLLFLVSWTFFKVSIIFSLHGILPS
jgi:hypothetical protein